MTGRIVRMEARPVGALGALVATAPLLTGCSVIRGTREGLTGSPSEESSGTASAEGGTEGPDTDQIVIEVRFDDDFDTALDVEVDIESSTSPQSLREDMVSLPFSEES